MSVHRTFGRRTLAFSTISLGYRFEVVHYVGLALMFCTLFGLIYGIDSLFGITASSTMSLSIASLLWLFLLWL